MSEKTLRPKVLSCVVCDTTTIEKMAENGFSLDGRNIKLTIIPHQNNTVLMSSSLFKINWIAEQIQKFETEERNKRIQEVSG